MPFIWVESSGSSQIIENYFSSETYNVSSLIEDEMKVIKKNDLNDNSKSGSIKSDSSINDINN